MRLLTIEEIRKLDSGEIIPAFEGKIKKVFDQKTGTSQHGVWHLQNFIVSQGEEEITATWGGEDSMKNLEGQTMHFESSDTKHGKQGLKWEVRDVKGNKYEGIKITSSAKITPADGGSGSPTATKSTPSATPTSVEYDEDAAVREARGFAMKMANALLIALEASRYVSSEFEKKHLGEEILPEQQQAMTSSIFISMNREGVGNNLPAHPLKPLVRESVLPEKSETAKPAEADLEW